MMLQDATVQLLPGFTSSSLKSLVLPPRHKLANNLTAVGWESIDAAVWLAHQNSNVTRALCSKKSLEQQEKQCCAKSIFSSFP